MSDWVKGIVISVVAGVVILVIEYSFFQNQGTEHNPSVQNSTSAFPDDDPPARQRQMPRKESGENKNTTYPRPQIPSSHQDSVKRVIIDKEGNQYGYLKMKDNNIWLTNNLNLKVPESICLFSEPCDPKFGRLYSQDAAKLACELLGQGWRLPTDTEWQNLLNAYGGFLDVQNKNKKVGNMQKAYAELGEYGSAGLALITSFSITKHSVYGNVQNTLEGDHGTYWTSSLHEQKGLLYSQHFPVVYHYGKNKIVRTIQVDKSYFSCRCINSSL